MQHNNKVLSKLESIEIESQVDSIVTKMLSNSIFNGRVRWIKWKKNIERGEGKIIIKKNNI